MLGSRFKPYKLIFALAASALAVAASSFAAEENNREPLDSVPRGVTADGLLTITVVMREPGHYWIGPMETTPDTIVEDLRKVRGDYTPAHVRLLLQANAKVSYEEFLPMLKALRAEGYKIGLINADVDLSTLK